MVSLRGLLPSDGPTEERSVQTGNTDRRVRVRDPSSYTSTPVHEWRPVHSRIELVIGVGLSKVSLIITPHDLGLLPLTRYTSVGVDRREPRRCSGTGRDLESGSQTRTDPTVREDGNIIR